nr:MAG TPA: hypothetical protein [Caudoviricetes sp.]
MVIDSLGGNLGAYFCVSKHIHIKIKIYVYKTLTNMYI